MLMRAAYLQASMSQLQHIPKSYYSASAKHKQDVTKSIKIKIKIKNKLILKYVSVYDL